MLRLTSRTAVFVSVIASSVALGACSESAEVGSDSVSRSEIESQATAELTKEVGHAPASIVCPSDLDLKAGASQRCTLTDDDGTKYAMTATIDSVSDDNTAEWTYKVADKPE